MYEYAASLIRVVDGDTVWLDVDLGFGVSRKDSFRLYGINAPELSTPAGPPASQHLLELLGFPITVRTIKDKREKYGRYLATIICNGIDVNQKMIDDGFAVAYMVSAHGS